MIELPEAETIARQMAKELVGKRIERATQGNWPLKWAFYTGTPEDYASVLEGATLTGARGHGSHVLLTVESGQVLVLGGGGERILYHKGDASLPKKRQLLLQFTDGTYLTVSIQGWGSVQLLRETEVDQQPHIAAKGPSPLSDAFTPDYLESLFAGLALGNRKAIKYFVISEPGIWGVGNGYLQDILFRARIHPRRKAVDVSVEEQNALYMSITGVLREAVALGGRDSEYDLYGQRGLYERVLHSKMVGQPCPNCGTPVEKIQFLGGSCYFCPACQM